MFHSLTVPPSQHEFVDDGKLLSRKQLANKKCEMFRLLIQSIVFTWN